MKQLFLLLLITGCSSCPVDPVDSYLSIKPIDLHYDCKKTDEKTITCTLVK